MAVCDDKACPIFEVTKYLRDLRQHLPVVPPISTSQLQALHASRDHKGMVRLIKRAMNIETDVRVVWVSKGEAEDAKIKHAPAWIRLPSEMPPYGSEAFRQLRIDIFLGRSFSLGTAAPSRPARGGPGRAWTANPWRLPRATRSS
jgi:hypothetical protein